MHNHSTFMLLTQRKVLLLLLAILFYIPLSGQIPSGYYSSAQGLFGEELRQALHQIIRDHNAHSYGDLWQDFYETDRKANGKVWDMYSDNPGGNLPYEYTFFSDQCGNYSQEGDCYNREHSWPSSWFGGNAAPMYTDLYHIVPTDGYVNNRRSNHPFGEVNNPSWVSANGSKVGSNTTSGYNGTVFEPIDAYKGDLARGMLYMTVRYYGQGNNWPGSDMAIGADLRPWALQLMQQWHEQDPVSEKEINRNNAIYALQGNRNPFIDHPEFVDLIWDETAAISQTEWPQFDVYPNPASDYVYVSTSSMNTANEFTIVVTDQKGRKLYQVHTEGQQALRIDYVNQLSPGFYMLHILQEDATPVILKLLKQ
jgi:endonuclease I